MGIFFNNNEEYQHGSIDEVLPIEGKQEQASGILQAVLTIRNAVPEHEIQIGRVTGNTATAHLFRNLSTLWHPRPSQINPDDEETVQGLYEGDSLGGLHLLNKEVILDQTDRMAHELSMSEEEVEGEVAGLDAEHMLLLDSFNPIVSAPQSVLDEMGERARQEIDRITGGEPSNENFVDGL